MSKPTREDKTERHLLSHGPGLCLNLLVAPLITLSLLGCDVSAPSESSTARHSLVASTPSLASQHDWQTYELETTRLVTPLWSADGERLLVRGFHGRGLYLFDAATTELEHAEPDYVGDAAFDEESVCRGPNDDRHRLVLNTATRSWTSTATPCAISDFDAELGERIAAGPWGAIYHDAYRGIITKVDARGERVELEERGAWNVAVSADGRRLAWCLGTVSEPQLLVYDEASGYHALDRGVHPTWSPNGRYLVFSIPEVIEMPSGLTSYRAELELYDVEQDRRVALTDTQSIAEMQPRFSPDGRHIAFADWAGRSIHVAAFDAGRIEGGER